MKGYLSIRETSYKWGVSERRVNQYVTDGRIPDMERFRRSWAIPAEAEKPGDCAVTMIGNSSKLQRIGNSCTMNL